jgi:hypothetical protein
MKDEHTDTWLALGPEVAKLLAETRALLEQRAGQIKKPA